LIALGADVNQRNNFNMAALDTVNFMLTGDPAHPILSDIIKAVGGVSGTSVPPQPQPAAAQQMDTGEQTMSKAGTLLSLSPSSL
jgi:hypothetical protein